MIATEAGGADGFAAFGLAAVIAALSVNARQVAAAQRPSTTPTRWVSPTSGRAGGRRRRRPSKTPSISDLRPVAMFPPSVETCSRSTIPISISRGSRSSSGRIDAARVQPRVALDRPASVRPQRSTRWPARLDDHAPVAARPTTGAGDPDATRSRPNRHGGRPSPRPRSAVTEQPTAAPASTSTATPVESRRRGRKRTPSRHRRRGGRRPNREGGGGLVLLLL